MQLARKLLRQVEALHCKLIGQADLLSDVVRSPGNIGGVGDAAISPAC